MGTGIGETIMEHVPLFLHSAGNVTHRMFGLHNKA